MAIINILRKLPIDLGQREMRGKTMGKQIAIDIVKNGKNKLALDVGCREGDQSELLKKKGYKVKSIDIERKYKHCAIVDVNKKLPFDKNSFDLIWSSEVIEHLDNPDRTIQEFRRILKPGGEMILTTPNSYSLVFLFGLLAKKLQRKDHKQYFDISQIRFIFPNAKVYGYFPYFGKLRYKIRKLVGLLSPTFIIHEEIK